MPSTFTFLIQMFHHVGQTGLKLLTSGVPLGLKTSSLKTKWRKGNTVWPRKVNLQVNIFVSVKYNQEDKSLTGNLEPVSKAKDNFKLFIDLNYEKKEHFLSSVKLVCEPFLHCNCPFFFFFETEFRSCYPGWSAMAPSRLTATSASWVQAILLTQPSK